MLKPKLNYVLCGSHLGFQIKQKKGPSKEGSSQMISNSSQ